jgi:RNA polymerase sigma-70 factor (sigma-E family)
MTSETVPELALVRPARLARSRSRARPEAREAVLELYSEHYSSLVRLAHLMAHDPSQAEDIVHEAFLKMYGAWRRIQDPEKALPYLRTTVANGARGRARRHLIALRHRPAAPANAAAAEDGALVRESQRAVVDALRELPTRQRQCLVLRHYEDLSESEIAGTLGISVGSVRTHVKRGSRALQRKLGEFR